MEMGLGEDEIVELWALMDAPDDAYTAAPGGGKGRKRKRCLRTPLHPHCKSVKWSRVYEALRRKGKSKKNSAQIANYMYNKWRQGRVVRKAYP
jgi:hypothetical protein